MGGLAPSHPYISGPEEWHHRTMVPSWFRRLCRRVKDVTVGAIAAVFALLLIIFLDLRKTIVFERRTLLRREIVKPGIVVAKDRPLDLAVSRSQWFESVLFLHFVRNLEPTEGFDLPLGRPGPDRI